MCGQETYGNRVIGTTFGMVMKNMIDQVASHLYIIWLFSGKCYYVGSRSSQQVNIKKIASGIREATICYNIMFHKNIINDSILLSMITGCHTHINIKSYHG